ncbi:hypothetical protein DFH28DRAFT_968857 [Melampsora americana]|nr:hypothetical protein DFH28DRAFT_968857 [Melampsora americana]
MVYSNRNKAQQARRATEAEQSRIDDGIVLFIEYQIVESETDQECDDQLKEQLFPVFLSHDIAKAAIGKRKNKLGNLRQSKRHINHPNPLKKQLIYKLIPKSTLQYRQKKVVWVFVVELNHLR